MKEKLHVFYWKLHDGHGNFGDELNDYIISRLSGRNISRIIVPLSGFNYLNFSLRSIYHNQISYKDIPLITKQFFINNFIVGIGSIISRMNSKSCKVWGSGIMSKDDIIKPAIFCAVRGLYTQTRLRELNLPVPETIGDPALLLPIIYAPKPCKKFKLGIIPHFIHYKSIKEKIKYENVIVINLTDEIEKIIDQINSCEYTISTSLHGIIVAQAYNIPSLWFSYNEESLPGDNIKFYDYFSSIGIDEYTPFNLIPEEFDINNIIELFIKFKNLTSIIKSIEQIQNQLLKVAPFIVLDKYKLLE